MGRLRLLVCAVVMTAGLMTLGGCGGSTPATPGFGVPAVIRLTPNPTLSMDLGTTVQFSASALSGTRAPLNTTFAYRTSNPNIVSIADNGLACAGTWDSVATPIVCTPGGSGSAQVTASAAGVFSAPTTIYVHQHIAQILVQPIPITVPPLPSPVDGCYTSLANSLTTANAQSFQASAMADDATGHPTIDITSTVGPFFWSVTQPSVATVTALNSNGIPNGQAQITAHTPGFTQVTAGVGDATSGPYPFKTCAVQSISLQVNVTGGTTISGPKGTSSSITPTVIDTAGNQIAPTLTWSSSNTAVASVSSAGGVTSPGAGGATITASCTSPTCNINLTPPQPIYPVTPVSAVYTETTPTAFNVYVASSNATCAANAHCQAFLVPITGTPPLAGTGTLLTGAPNQVPNSIKFAAGGSTAFIGTQIGLASVAVSASPPTVTTSPSLPGKVLAVSPDGKKVIVANTTSPVNQVFVFDTVLNRSTNLLISGATAAAFSPDSTKAFIVAGSTLYVYSTNSALQVVPLSAPGLDVAFLSNGMFGYVAQGASGTSYLATCDNPSLPWSQQLFTVPAAMNSIRPLPDGSGFVGLNPPYLTTISTSITGSLAPGVSGCPTPVGGLTASNSVSAVDLGLGTFTPLAFLLSSDAQKAYIVLANSPTIHVYDLISQLSSSFTLVGNPNPLAAALAPDGQTLYVSADDSNVHVINTVSGGDVYQVSVPPSSLCTITTGGAQPNCLPDLLAVRP